MNSIEEFRRAVLRDPVLLERLRATEPRHEFIPACVEAARELGLRLAAEDVEAALQQARRGWIERWIA